MRRADRLFLLIHALRGRRSALTAQRLADELGVSLRLDRVRDQPHRRLTLAPARQLDGPLARLRQARVGPLDALQLRGAAQREVPARERVEGRPGLGLDLSQLAGVFALEGRAEGLGRQADRQDVEPGEVEAKGELGPVKAALNESCEFMLPPLADGEYAFVFRIADIEFEIPSLKLGI